MVLESPGRLILRELPLPDIGDEDALLRVEACGLCGTDHEQYSGALPAGFAFIPGHESVGIIDRIGERASERWGVVEGDRVAVEVFQSCRRCDQCTKGEYRRCQHHGLRDMYGFIPVEQSPCLWGGFATYQYLAPDSMVLPVPSALDAVNATLFNPLGAGIRWGRTLPETASGDVVAVLGAGVRGLCTLVGAREAGAGFVMVTGSGSNDGPRLEMASRFGADLVVDVARADPVAELLRATGRLADVVVDVTAKAPAAFAQAIALARPAGTVVVAGTRGTAETPTFNPDHIVFKELRLLGALGVDSLAYASALELLASTRYPFDSLPHEVVSLAGLEELLVAMSGDGARKPPLHGVLVP